MLNFVENLTKGGGIDEELTLFWFNRCSNWKLNVPPELFYKDSMGIVSKRFFAGGQYVFPTIVRLRDRNYLFRYSGIDAEILAEIKSKLKER